MNFLEHFELSPIGVGRNSILTPQNTGWGDVVSSIHIKADYQNGLRGLEDFSHLLVVFWMHQAEFNLTKDLIRHPHNRNEIPACGIFAQRARCRPNPIGVTTVSLLGVSGNIIKVEGLDAIDGTPLLDIKPCVPFFDQPNDVKTPDWVKLILSDYF